MTYSKYFYCGTWLIHTCATRLYTHITRCKPVCCSVLQCVVVCCSVLQCVAVCCSVLQHIAVYCSVLQCVAVCCSVLQCAVVCCSVLRCVAVCCSVLQCLAVCCSVLQYAAVAHDLFKVSSYVTHASFIRVSIPQVHLYMAHDSFKVNSHESHDWVIRVHMSRVDLHVASDSFKANSHVANDLFWVALHMAHESLISVHLLQGGEDPYDALSCRSFFTKEPLIIGLFCRKWPTKIRHSMGLCHPVRVYPHVAFDSFQADLHVTLYSYVYPYHEYICVWRMTHLKYICA